ncbi:hypothetical protein [Streptomyces sp. G45]|uniref:hypothetical protein n=1 Tax=Streptomyces sp. G45 TaxID=3406627 RepID=UPI003C144E5E
MALPGTRRTRTLALGTASAVALLTAGLAWQASAADSDAGGRPAPGAKPDVSVGKRIEHAPSSAAEYWTPERMRAAKPAPMPADHR